MKQKPTGVGMLMGPLNIQRGNKFQAGPLNIKKVISPERNLPQKTIFLKYINNVIIKCKSRIISKALRVTVHQEACAMTHD